MCLTYRNEPVTKCETLRMCLTCRNEPVTKRETLINVSRVVIVKLQNDRHLECVSRVVTKPVTKRQTLRNVSRVVTDK